jgi:hypothetical protein
MVWHLILDQGVPGSSPGEAAKLLSHYDLRAFLFLAFDRSVRSDFGEERGECLAFF